MKILVTGGNGEFCKHLVEQGKEHSFLTPTKSELDVRSYWGIDQYFYRYNTNFDYVIHAAALKQVPATEYNPIEAVKTNILGTNNVLSIAKKKNVKKVLEKIL